MGLSPSDLKQCSDWSLSYIAFGAYPAQRQSETNTRTWLTALLRLLTSLSHRSRPEIGLQGFQIFKGQWAFRLIASLRFGIPWMHRVISYRSNMCWIRSSEITFIGRLSKSLGLTPPGGLHPKMVFYIEHFLELRDWFIVWPQYTFYHWVHALCIPLGQFRVGSHKLWVDIDHQID